MTSDTQIGDLLGFATDKSYDWIALHEKLCEENVRPLIMHRLFRPIGHAHNARIDVSLYCQ